MVGHRKSSILEWGILLGLTASAVAVSEVVGLTPLWRDAVAYTVILFAAILTALRPPWRQGEFWRSLAAVFAGHSIVLLLVVQVLQAFPERRRHGVPKLILLPVAALEGVIVAGKLWKTMVKLRPASTISDAKS